MKCISALVVFRYAKTSHGKIQSEKVLADTCACSEEGCAVCPASVMRVFLDVRSLCLLVFPSNVNVKVTYT